MARKRSRNSGEETVKKHAGKTDSRRRRSLKKKAVAATTAGEKCRGETRCSSPWQGTISAKAPFLGDASDDLLSRVGEVITAGEATVT